MACTLTNAIVTCRDIASASRFFIDGLKLLPVLDSQPDPVKTGELWGLDKEYPIRSLVLKRRAEDSIGWIRLVELSGASGGDVRQGRRMWDHGLLTIEFGVEDGRANVQRMVANQYKRFAGPQRYDFRYFDDPAQAREGYYVIDSIVEGPHGVRADLLERHNAPYLYGTIDPESGFTEYIGSAIVVPTMDEGVRFFHEVLGIPVRGRFHNPGGPHFSEMLKIPPDVGFDWSFVVDISRPGCFVELLAFPSLAGAPAQEGPSLLGFGGVALSFSCDDLTSIYERVKQYGGDIVCDPTEVELDGIGPARAFSCLGPSRLLCELYESRRRNLRERVAIGECS